MTVELNFETPAQTRTRSQALRSQRGLRSAGRSESARQEPRCSDLENARPDTLVQRLRRSFEELVAIDFYPGQAQSAGEGGDGRLSSAKPSVCIPRASRVSAAGRVRRLDPAKYRNRIWATRKDPWVDRLASAWLIRRFIDSNAKFAWIERPRDRPRGAVGFDFDGAEFTHVGNRVTFEVLVSSFGLDSDPALGHIAAIVHFLDVGGIPVEDAKGLELVLKGARDSAHADDELALSAARIFDHVYVAYSKQGAV